MDAKKCSCVCMTLFLLNLHFLYVISTFEPFINGSECNTDIDQYEPSSCKIYWDCTIQALLQDWMTGVKRTSIYDMDFGLLAHTPMWLRVTSGKLYCVPVQETAGTKFRLKLYRALHYINRLNRILRAFPKYIPDDTEWLSHHSDWLKVPKNISQPPIFGVSGSKLYNDIPGIPFMSFSDAISHSENSAFNKFSEQAGSFHKQWKTRRSSAFFRGTLSDCSAAISLHNGDINYCSRAKVIFEAAQSKSPLMSNIKAIPSLSMHIQSFKNCSRCTGEKLSGDSFVRELHSHKYLLNFAGAGNWSRRLSLLLRSGGLIFQAESPGYQFYDMGMRPGTHFIPYDPGIGRRGAGNLLSRLVWAKQHDSLAEAIAQRTKTFGSMCLKEQSIDYFVRELLRRYGQLLQGTVKKVFMIDLTSCLCSERKKRCKPSKLCKGVIERCWGAWEYDKVR